MQSDKISIGQINRYESIFNATSDSIMIYDENGFIVEANHSASRIFGYSYDELIGMHVSKLYVNPGNFNELKDIALAGGEYSGSHSRIRKDGSQIEVNFVGTGFEYNGKPHVLSLAKDITLQKKAEEVLKKREEAVRNKEKKTLSILETKVKERTRELEKTNHELLQFTSIASHDLKEPVRKILIYGKMLKESIGATLDKTNARYLENMINSSLRMTNLIDDLLALSRLSQGRPIFTSVDLNTIVKQVLDDLELMITEKDATIEIDHLPTIEGNALQLGEIFQNLISNSLKFAFPGRKPVITITTESYTEEDKTFHIFNFRDNGIGFKAEYSEQIFEIFQRLHSRSQFEGTGVGLAIVMKIINLHRGSITATGNENEGAEFCIVLPEKQ